MTDPKFECSVFRYVDKPGNSIWTIDGRVTFRLVERNHAHDHGIEISGLDFTATVRLGDLVKAIEWIKRCEP